MVGQSEAAGLDDFTRISYGMSGLETEMRVIYSEGVGRGRISIQTFVLAFSTMPAKIFGLYPRKGTIAVGSNADLVLFDPQGLNGLTVATCTPAPDSIRSTA
jgi:dihydropyrimidinase